MSRDPDDALLSVAQAATLLGVHPNTIRSWTNAGRLAAYRINARGDRRYRRSEVAALLVQDRAADLGPGAVPAAGHTDVTGTAQALDRARAELERVRALRAVTKELTGTLDLERVLDDVVERTRTMFGADRAGIWLFDETPHPVPLVTRGLSDRFLAQSAELTRDSDTIALRALRAGRPQWTSDADRAASVGEMRAAYAAEGIQTACIVPLRSRGESLGAIGLYHDADRDWPDEEIDLVQAFADQAAVAIQNARLYRSAADQAARMRSIQDLSSRLNRLTDVRAIAEAIVAEARTLAEYHDIRVYRVDHEVGVCEPIAFTRRMLEDGAGDPTDLLRVAIGEGFTGWVAEHGEPLLVNDALDDERGKTIEGTDDVPESMLVVPMLYEGRVLGVIVLSQLGFGRFSADDLQTMTIFAGYAAQAIANADTYATLLARSAELGRRAESQRRLLEINERLLTTLDPASVLETIADGLRDVVAYDNLSIYRADHARGVMLPVLAREQHAEEVSRYVIPFGRGLMGWSVEHGQPILANDALNDPRALQIPGTPPDPEAVAVVPLLSEGMAIGALNVSRVGGPEVHFSPSDFELVQLFAAQASIALRNADTHDAMRQQADTDALTGLGNHGAFQRELARAVDAAVAGGRGRGRLAVLMMDLDRFKGYNDRHGHPAGDALLHRTAMAIYGAARSDDRVYRYGGDEFAMILPDATAAQATRLAERIRRSVSALNEPHSSRVTITIGVASMPRDGADRPALIAAADTALYYGKHAGGDRVVAAAELPEDVHDLRGTLDQLASAALREGEDASVVEHLAVHASALSGALSGVRLEPRSEGEARSHLERVGRLASTLAETLGLDDDERRSVELAAHLEDLDDRSVARLSTVPWLRDAATILVGQRTLRAEAARRARRAGRARGRSAVHVVAAAALYDALVTGAHDPAAPALRRDEAIEALRRHPATLRADVVDALAVVVGHRPDAGRRQRRSERRGERNGALGGEARGAA